MEANQAQTARRVSVHDRESEQGIALIMGVLFTIIISGLVVTGTLVMRSHRANTETSFRLHGQAAQFARAGLTDAMAWFRKQTTQPVKVFDPILNASATPPILDTIDPDVGIVREFQISGPIWGRYEVWKEWDADPDSTRLAWRQKVQAEDISSRSSVSGDGNVWYVQSIGYVFRQMDSNIAFNTYPNQVLGTEILGSEIRRLTLAPPAQAAVCSQNECTTTIESKVNIQGGVGAGVFSLYSSSCSVTETGSPTIEGVVRVSSSSSYDDSVESVFGVSEKDLQALADDVITTSSLFPSPAATNSLYYVEVPTLTFSDSLPLAGTSVVYVKGNVVLSYNSKSYFTGMLYVNGDLTIREPCDLNGTIICNGTVLIQGQSDWININYDDDALNSLRTAIGQYRLSAAVRKVLSSE